MPQISKIILFLSFPLKLILWFLHFEYRSLRGFLFVCVPLIRGYIMKSLLLQLLKESFFSSMAMHPFGHHAPSSFSHSKVPAGRDLVAGLWPDAALPVSSTCWFCVLLTCTSYWCAGTHSQTQPSYRSSSPCPLSNQRQCWDLVHSSLSLVLAGFKYQLLPWQICFFYCFRPGGLKSLENVCHAGKAWKSLSCWAALG